MAFYLGKRPQGDLILFRSPFPPTKETHGHRFTAVIGPFRSKVGASYFARYGQGNPHIHTVADVERLARLDPRMEQAIAEESLTAAELDDTYRDEWNERHADELSEYSISIPIRSQHVISL